MSDHFFSLFLFYFWSHLQGVYYVKDVDYNDVAAQKIPIVMPSGRYKINVKAHHKNEFVLGASVLMTVKMDKKSTN